MISLLQSIVDVISSALSFIVNALKSLVVIITHIPTYVDFLISGIAYLPSVIIPFATASIMIYVIFFLINRKVS